MILVFCTNADCAAKSLPSSGIAETLEATNRMAAANNSTFMVNAPIIGPFIPHSTTMDKDVSVGSVYGPIFIANGNGTDVRGFTDTWIGTRCQNGVARDDR